MRPRNFYQRSRPVPRRLAGLGAVPTVPNWTPAPMPAPPPMPNHRGMSEQSAQCAVEQLRPLNFTRSENVLLALIAGGFFGYWLGKGK
jgi:hypothetical protein